MSFHLRKMLAVAFLSAAPLLHSAEIVVENPLDNGSGSLRDAINVAASNDVISFSNDLTGTISLQSPLPWINKNLTINGSANNEITIDGGGQHQIFFIDSGAT